MVTHLCDYRRYVVLVMVVTLLAALSAPVWAQGNRYFPETGFIVDVPILPAFNRFGGVPVIGLPISDGMETMCETHPCIVQWFERTRIEYHQDDGQAYRGRIGADFLSQRGSPWQFGDGTNPGPCQLFPETGHAACGAFLDAWRRYGGSERLGLPITDVQDETYVDGGTGQTVTFRTQWFERAALEDHGTQGMQIRLLGSQTYPSWAEHLMADLINAERVKAGVPVLTWHDGLAQVAREHSVDLATHNARGHIGSDGRDPIARTSSLHLDGFCSGEVVSYQQSPVRAVSALMQSPEHKTIMLHDYTTHMGVGYGVVVGQVRGEWPATVWTVDFWSGH